jgi:hypothetical protein
MSAKNDTSWTITTLETEDGPRVYRVRQMIPEGLSKQEYSRVVIIEWPHGNQPLPDDQTLKAMLAFEELLDPLDNHLENSLLVHVYSGAGIREWCYYTKNYDWFMQELNRALSNKPRFPIQIVHDNDPAWKYQAGIKEASQGK